MIETDAVTRLLRKRACRVKCLGHGRWEFQMRNVKDLHVTARLDEDLFCVSAQLPQPSVTDPWELVRRCETLPGLAKIGRHADVDEALIRAQVPLVDELEFVARVRSACSDVRVGARLAASTSGRTARRVKRSPAALDTIASSAHTIHDVLSEAGWTSGEPDRKRLLVPLGVSGGTLHAVVLPEAHGGFHAYVEVARLPLSAAAGDGAEARCTRQALGHFLLEVNATLRVARAVIVANDREFELRFECRMPGVSEADVSAALEALASGCHFFAREIALLAGDTAFAAEYLCWVQESEEFSETESLQLQEV